MSTAIKPGDLMKEIGKNHVIRVAEIIEDTTGTIPDGFLYDENGRAFNPTLFEPYQGATSVLYPHVETAPLPETL